MRTATAPELAVLASATRQVTHRVKVKNGSGTWIDRSSWVDAVSIDQDIDQPVSGCTVSFRRDSGTTESLAPLRTDSTLNRLDDGTTYSPALDVNRAITVEVATTAIGAAVVGGDYKLLFEGTIDTVSFERSPVVVTCRDAGAILVDRWIEVAAPYGSTPGVDLEIVMAAILNNAFGGAVPLYTPVSPSYLVSPAYVQQRQSIMDAMGALAQLPGWDVRYRWDGGTSTFRFTLSEPPRTKTTPDHTFSPSDYFEVTRLELDLTNIKNVITVSYPDAAQNGHLDVTVFDTPSITKYGRRYFFIEEPSGSPISTNAEATAMANAALSDLKEPKADFEIDAPFFWPADLWDLYRFPTNSVHFNTNQDWAVVTVSHELSKNRHRTKLQVRGQPAGGYASWRGRAADPNNPRPGEVGPEAHIEEMGGSTNPGVENIRYTGTGGTQPYTYERRIDVDTISTGTWSAPAALGSGVTEWVAVNAYHPTRIYLRVTDATGLVGNADPFSLMGSMPAIEPTSGKVKPNVPMEGGDYPALANVSGEALLLESQGALATVSLVTPALSQGRNRCQTYNSVNQTLTTTTSTVITWDGEVFDVGTLHSTASNTGRITIPTGGDTGEWVFIAQLSFAANGTGMRSVEIRRSDGITMANVAVPPVASGPATVLQVIAIDSAPAAGTWYEARGFQSSGGNLDVISVGTNPTSFFAAHHSW